jgi:beta-N-acetylhexosaminidase
MAWSRHLLARAGRPAFCLTAVCCGMLATAPPARSGGARRLTLSELVGQRLVVALHGTQADGWLRGRIRAGEIGGVILFSSNVASPSQLSALSASLQAAARAGGQPRLIISTDQEGGLVRRIPWAPPRRSAEQLGKLASSVSDTAGSRTGAALRNVGVNVDLAPVADVPAGPSDFIQQQHRAFSTSRYTVARDAAAFAHGLESRRVWPVLKHFPGLGLATVSTDDALVRITASSRTLIRRLLPYKVAFRRGLDPVAMLSTAIYPALDWRAAAWSRPIIRGLLHRRLGFTGVTMTDSLDAAAAVRHQTDDALALRSVRAGADLILITGSESASARVFQSLLTAARAGTIPRSRLVASYDRILALKGHL